MKKARYPSYRHTGLAWSPEVPDHWDTKRLRFVLDTKSRRPSAALPPESEVSFVPMDAVGEHGELRLTDTKSLADIGSGYTCFADGDVVVAKITPCFENGKGALASGLTNGIAFGTTELHVLRAVPSELDRKFLYYLTASFPFRKLGEASMYGTRCSTAAFRSKSSRQHSLTYNSAYSTCSACRYMLTKQKITQPNSPGMPSPMCAM